jgi:formylglycine-generating enzyme required for sulfatase activity
VLKSKTILSAVLTLALISVINTAPAQEVSIPDPGLNAAVRETLQKPVGPLTEQDMLGLTVLNAHDRNISNLAGLEAARNLNTLLLFSNHLTNFFLPSLTNLVSLNLSANSLTNVSLPGGMTKLFSLLIGVNALTQITLPSDLTQLEELDLQGNQLTSFTLPPGLTGLGVLDLTFNALTNVSLPDGLTNLDLLRLSENSLTNFTVPTGLSRLTQLYLDQNQLTSFTLPVGVTNLHVLDFTFNQLTNLNLPADLRNLISMDLSFNQLTSLNLPANLTGLALFQARSNRLTNFNLPPDLTALTLLDIGENQLQSVNLPAGLGHLINLRLSGNTNLTSLTLPVGMTNLSGIFLRFNGLTNLTLPSDLNRLHDLDVLGNRLTSLTLPPGMTNLANLFLSGNQLTTLTLPPDMTHLTSLVLNGNPLTAFILSEPLAATNLAATVTNLQNQGVQVFTFPLSVRLTLPQQQRIGEFRFGITGPPAVYTVYSSSNLTDWTVLNFASNPLGSVLFTDAEAPLSPRKFYRALLVTPPTNMVFIAPNVFTLGSPANEVGHQSDESPQTDVSLTHGFWIGKYEVTQAEYLALTGENPSGFPGDLHRPVESVSFFAASNYCALLTQQELAAERIPPGSHYRLPTEAEWECAARAGSTTRFYYGDDPDLTGLPGYAWFGAHNGITTHPVGQKLPNAWGLYDMAGNVWEWCQDWYGEYPGGDITDPQGPATNPIGWKVIRGGAWEASELDCRSARRGFEAASPFISDFIIGFRVVLVTEP